MLCAKGPFAADHEIPIRSKRKIERAQFGVVDEAGGLQHSMAVEHSDRVIAFAGGAHARGQIEVTLSSEAEASRKGNNPVRKNSFSLIVETGRESEDGPAAP
jgi:hypothetical protein